MFEFLLASDQPFATLNWWMILTVALVHAVGCFIRGAYGFGSNMPIVVATTFIIGPHHAILLALMTTIISSPSFPAIEPNSRRDAPLKSVFIEIFDFDKSATKAFD